MTVHHPKPVYTFTPDQVRAWRETWLAKLEEEEMQTKQTDGVLEDEQGFCCLGVAASLICPETRRDYYYEGDGRVRGVRYGFEEQREMAPEVVIAALGLRSEGGAFLDENFNCNEDDDTIDYGDIKELGSGYKELTTMNDNGFTFRQIARFIRLNMKAVFMPLADEQKVAA